MEILIKSIASLTATRARLLLFLAVAALFLSATVSWTSNTLVARGWVPNPGGGGAIRAFTSITQGGDSWRPMLRALQVYEAGEPIYETVFFAEKVIFQYPLTSLLPLIALRQAGVSQETLLALALISSWLAVWATVGVSIAIYFAVRRTPASPGDSWMATVALTVAGLTFYPLLWGYEIGQIQTILTLFFAIACYCWIRGRERTAGALIALMILVKPQYAFIGLWFALRKKFQALWATVLVAGIGLAAVLAVFGWREQWKYLDVLRQASQGHGYFRNQSFNGLANRLVFNGPNTWFDGQSDIAFHPVVFAMTMLAMLGLLGAAFILPRSPQSRCGIADLCGIAVAATAASPQAWVPHYGILFPVIAFLVATIGRREMIPLAVAYALVANSSVWLNVFANIPVLNVLHAAPLAGVLIILVLLWGKGSRQGPADIPARGDLEEIPLRASR